MSFKSKFNKYARKIASVLTHFDDEGDGKDPLLDMLRRIQSSTPVVFDVGANIGQSIVRFKKVLPKSKIYSFEPSERPFAQLSVEASRYSDVKAFQLALGSSNGELTLYENSSSDMNSFLEMGCNGSGSVVGQSVVSVLTIDAFCSEHQINYIDILKIDAQGFDFEVIKGAKQMILDGKIRQPTNYSDDYWDRVAGGLLAPPDRSKDGGKSIEDIFLNLNISNAEFNKLKEAKTKIFELSKL